MDSKSLIKNGFQKFGKFNYDDILNRKSTLNFSGVYAFVLDTDFTRLYGITNIIYIGHTSSRPIYERMTDYCKAYKSAPRDKRISDQIKQVITKIRIGLLLKDEALDNQVTLFIKRLKMINAEEKNLIY